MVATQIAATPVLRGKEAYAVLEESKKKPTPVSRRGVEFLKNKFRLRVYDNPEYTVANANVRGSI